MKTKQLLITAAAGAFLLFVLALSSPAQTVQSVPFYRIFTHATGIHFWTTDINRKLSAQGAGWSDEGTPFYILNQQAAGTVPLYVLTIKLNFLSRNGIGDVFLFTTREEERTTLLNSPMVDFMLGGYTHDRGGKWFPDGTGMAGYIAATQLPGTVPLYRLYHPPAFGPEENITASVVLKVAGGGTKHRYCVFSDYDALLTINEQEKANALTQHGYQYVETLGYVWPSAMAVSMQPAKNTPKLPVSTDKPINVDTVLLKAGCLRVGMNVGQYGCANLGAFNACQSYLNAGLVKGCAYTATPAAKAAQKEMDEKLFSLGCTHFLGRSEEFLCKTPASYNACVYYRDNKKLAKRCEMAK